MQLNSFDLVDRVSPTGLPRGVTIIDPVTGVKYVVNEFASFLELKKAFKESREKFDSRFILPEEELEVLLLVLLRGQTPIEHHVRYFKETKNNIPGVNELFGFAKLLVNTAVSGSNGVPYGKQFIRASKCISGCGFHKSVSDNSLLSRGASMLSNASLGAGADSLKGHKDLWGKLGSCGMCGCNLKEKVRFDLGNILGSVHADNLVGLVRMYGIKLFDVCWIFEELLRERKSPDFVNNKKAQLEWGGFKNKIQYALSKSGLPEEIIREFKEILK